MVVEFDRHHELQNGVAEKLQPLVALGLLWMLVQVRRVGDGAQEQLRVAKRVGDTLLQG